jgi:hypothetical protein
MSREIESGGMHEVDLSLYWTFAVIEQCRELHDHSFVTETLGVDTTLERIFLFVALCAIILKILWLISRCMCPRKLLLSELCYKDRSVTTSDPAKKVRRVPTPQCWAHQYHNHHFSVSYPLLPWVSLQWRFRPIATPWDVVFRNLSPPFRVSRPFDMSHIVD